MDIDEGKTLNNNKTSTVTANNESAPIISDLEMKNQTEMWPSTA